MDATTTSNGTQVSPPVDLHQRARNQQLSLSDLIRAAESFTGAGQSGQAADLYKVWIAYNDTDPLLHMACFNHAVILRQMGDLAGAIEALRMSLKVQPDFGPAHINLGRALEDSGLVGRAVEQWQVLSKMTDDVTPDRLNHRVMALHHSGRVLENAGRLEEAESALWRAIELQPEKIEAGQHWLGLRQQQCKWPILAASNHVTARQLLDSMSSMTLGCYADDPIFQLAKAYRYHKGLVGRMDTRDFRRNPVRQKSGTGQRLKVGYLSSDLREHAVGFALCEVFELHDKQNVEIFAYYSGERRSNDKTHDRIRNATDCWRDIASMSDKEAAAQIVTDEIDILIDVNGYTKQARPKIFAYRPAPVIVNFCGFPGTTSSPFHQYIITDAQIVPPENEIYYTEKVLRIACDQPVDRKREIAPRPTRAQVGLPENAFVFACFNGMQKITAPCFARWMIILKAAPGSVLWLLGGDEKVNQRLRQMAAQSGVIPERLIFASKTPNPHHLARIALADLFLDTFPYGAHSTAADAITMGLPVLTMPGKSFASRFCASIVASAGIPEMICATPDEYAQRAVAFARDRESLSEIRDSLARQRDTCALRDMPALARRLEELFWQMQGEAERGETPVPDFRNLDVYYEIGAELIQANIEFEDDEAYRQRYRDALAKWHAQEPIPYDSRLWTQPSA